MHNISMIYIYYYPQTIFPDIKNKKIPHLLVTHFTTSFISLLLSHQKTLRKKICNTFSYIIHRSIPQMCSIKQIINNTFVFVFSRIYRIVTTLYTKVFYHNIFYREFYLRRNFSCRSQNIQFFKNIFKWNLYCEDLSCLCFLPDIQ